MSSTLTDIAQSTGARARHAGAVTVDELGVAAAEAAKVYGEVERLLIGVPLEVINAQAQRTMRDLGVTFGLYGETQGDHVVPMDIFPRVIDAQEWTALMRGLAQRVAIWNAFFRDIYDS